MIVGYVNRNQLLCVPCAYAEEWDLEDECVFAVFDDDIKSKVTCPRCGIPLTQANTLVRCESCGHLRTRGGQEKEG